APVRRPLVQECTQSFLALGRNPPLRNGARGERPRLVDAASGDLRDERLGRGDSRGTRGQKLLNVRVDGAVEIRGRHDLVNQADLARPRRRKTRPGEKQLARRGSADLREGERRDHGGKDSEPDLREAEYRLILGNHDIADGGEPNAPAQRSSLYPP